MLPHAADPLTDTPVHVIGATGRTGTVLCRALAAAGTRIIPVVRDPARWHALALPGAPRTADLTDAPALAAALADAQRVVSVSYASQTARILAAAPPAARIVVTGTARRWSALPDPSGDAARDAESLILPRPDAAILHPTMIHGAPADGTLSRLARLSRLPVLPLPGGGRQSVQPIHVNDLVAALIAALARPWPTPAAIPLGGAAALPFAALIAAIARATGHRPPLILPIPTPLVRLAGRRRPALLRLLEDRTVPLDTMIDLLGIRPMPLHTALALQFGQ